MTNFYINIYIYTEIQMSRDKYRTHAISMDIYTMSQYSPRLKSQAGDTVAEIALEACLAGGGSGGGSRIAYIYI